MNKQRDNDTKYCDLCGCYLPHGVSECPSCGRSLNCDSFAQERKGRILEEQKWFLNIDKLLNEPGKVKSGGKIFDNAGCLSIVDEVINQQSLSAGRSENGKLASSKIVKTHKLKIEILWEEVQ